MTLVTEKPQGISLVLPPATGNKVGLPDGSELGVLDLLSFPMHEMRVILCGLVFVFCFLTSQGEFMVSQSQVL